MKLLGWLIRTVMTAGLIGFVAAATSLTTVNVYLDKLFASFEAASGIRVELSEVLGQLAGIGNSLLSSNMTQADRQSPEGAGSEPEEPVNDPEEAGEVLNDEVPISDDAVPVWSQQSDYQTAGSAAKDQILITGEQFVRVRDQMSDAEKMKIFTLLFQKLPQEEIQTLSLLMEDGVTGAELEQIDEILSQYLTLEEYEEVKSILGKY